MSVLKSRSLSLALLSLALVAGGARVASADELKIATVDMQKALQAVDAGKKAKAQLEKDFTSLKKQIDGEEAALKKMDEEFKKQSLVMNDEARAKKQGELQERFMKYQELRAKSQADIQKKEKELTGPLIERLRGVVGETAKSKGYGLVLEKNENTVLYSLEKDDITSEVISAFNKANKASLGGASAHVASN